MKASVASGILLVAITLLIILNAVHVNRTVNDFVMAVEALPSTPDGDTALQVKRVLELLLKKETFLTLSVPYTTLDRGIELCRSLLSYAESGSVQDYTATRELLIDALQDMARLEKLHVKNIF